MIIFIYAVVMPNDILQRPGSEAIAQPPFPGCIPNAIADACLPKDSLEPAYPERETINRHSNP